MNRMMAVVAAAVFVFLGLIRVWAEDPQPTVTLSISEIARQVQSRNLELFKAARNVERAREDLIGEPELMDSSLSLGGGYVGGWYGQSGLTLRLLRQLSAGTSVAVEESWKFGESVSLNIKPFEPARQTYSEERSFNSAVVRERYLKRWIYLDAEQAALDLLLSDMERELARSTEELEQRKYELAQRRQEVGDASFQDVQDQLVDLIKARQDLFSREQGYLGDWRTLQLLFAPSEERFAVAPLSVSELLELVSQRKAEVKHHMEVEPVTEKLENLRLELQALEAELKATPPWRPDLNLSTAVSLPYAYPDSHSVSFSLSFSPNQLKREDRKDLQEDIEVKRMEVDVETSAAVLQKSLELQNIALVEQALASAQIQAERDRVALQEAELLFQQGRRTVLELEQLRLNLWRARIQTFESAAEVYRVLGVYLMLFVVEGSG
jgi:outer membrane protein TolC